MPDDSNAAEALEGATPFWFSPDAAARAIPADARAPFATMMRHGTMCIEAYTPRGHDPQTPHLQDEIYAVVKGSGDFINGGERHAFGPGDMMFVPAGVEHRFVDFSDDLFVWVIFYGPKGGEAEQKEAT